jgi:hypothetical protein
MVCTSTKITVVGPPPCLSGSFFSKSNDVSSVDYNIIGGFGVFAPGSSALVSRSATPPLIRFVGLCSFGGVAVQPDGSAVVEAWRHLSLGGGEVVVP